MAAGTYQPIKVWDVEGFRSGAIPHIESASLAAKNGAPVNIDSAGRMAEAATSFQQAYGILSADGSNAAAAGATIMVIPIRPEVIFEVTLNEAWALALTGTQAGLLKDSTTKAWYLSTANAGNQMFIITNHIATAVGDTKMRVLARFNPNAIQAYPVNVPNLGLISASGAVTPNLEGTYVITKAGVAALTLAAPTALVDDGRIIRITSGTAFAHTLTATGLFNTGTASVNLATFAAFAGAGVTLMAYNAKWNVLASPGITFS